MTPARSRGRDALPLEQRQQLVALAPDFLQIGRVRKDKMGDAERLVFAQCIGHVVGRPNQPRRSGTAATEFTGRGIEIVVEHVAACLQVEQGAQTW